MQGKIAKKGDLMAYHNGKGQILTQAASPRDMCRLTKFYRRDTRIYRKTVDGRKRESIEAVKGLIYVALVLQRNTVHKELSNYSLDFQIGKRGSSSLPTSLRLSGERAAFHLLLVSKVLPYRRPVEPSKEYHLDDKYEEDKDEDSQTILDEIL